MDTTVSGEVGIVKYEIETNGTGAVTVELVDEDGKVTASTLGRSGELRVHDATFWKPRNQDGISVRQ